MENYYVPLYDDVSGAGPANVDNVFKSDKLVSHELHRRLAAQIASLEDVPLGELDWHPNSNEQVLDLVHPSLFCLVYGESRVVETEQGKDWQSVIGGGKVTENERCCFQF